MSTGLSYDLLRDGEPATPVPSLAAFAPPEGARWWLRPSAHLSSPELASLVVHDARAHKLTRLALRGLSDPAALPLAALPPLQALRVDAPRLSHVGLEALSEQRSLEELCLVDTAVERLDPLAGFAALRSLRVVKAPLAPDGVEALRQLTGLRALQLNGCVPLGGEGLDGPALRPLSALTSLERLSLRGARPGPGGLVFLRRLRGLRALDLSGGEGLDDDNLPPLADLTALTALQLVGRRGVRGPGLAALAGLTGLKRLDLSGTGLLHHALEHLVGLRALEQLNLSRTPLWDLSQLREALEARAEDDLAARMALTDAWPKRFTFRWEEGFGEDFAVEAPGHGASAAGASADQGPEELVLEALSEEDLVEIEDALPPEERMRRLLEAAEVYELDLGALAPPLSGLRALDGLPALRRLELADTPTDDAALRGLRLPALRTLSLARTRVTRLDGLGPLPELRSLDLSGCAPTPRLLGSLPRFSSLIGLALSDGGLEGGALEGICGLRALEALALHACTLTDGALAGLARLPALERLSLHGSALHDAGLDALGQAPALEALDLTRCELGEADRAALGGFQRLRHLDLTKVSVADADLAPLAGARALRWLGLAFTEVSREAVAALELALPEAVITRSFLPEDEER